MNKKSVARRVVISWIPAIAWMLLIFAGSTDVLSAEHTSRFIVPFLRWLDPKMSVQTIATVHMLIRKAGHVTEYAVLSVLLWRGLRGSFMTTPNATVAILAFSCAALFAISDEFHQSFTPTRTPSPHDVAIDCCGATLALLICWTFSRRRRLAVAKGERRD